MQSKEERRGEPRFEPPFIDAKLSYGNPEDDTQLMGRVLDSSKSGMAIAIQNSLNDIKEGAEIKVSISWADKSSDKIVKSIGLATVVRKWKNTGLFSEDQGLAVKFANLIDNTSISTCLLRGNKQQVRLKTQPMIAKHDVQYLGDYRRDLIKCQMRLFVNTMSVNVAILGAYLALIYHGAATNQLQDPTLSFWRMLIASLPGIFAISGALMVAQKSVSIQRIDAYLVILKRCIIWNQYPREYRGWESAYRRFRDVLNSNFCEQCTCKRKCGTPTKADISSQEKRKFIRNPKVGFYHVVMYTVFLFSFGISLAAIMIELIAHQFNNTIYIVVGALIATTIITTITGLFWIFYQLRRGSFSTEYYKRCWQDILHNCRWAL